VEASHPPPGGSTPDRTGAPAPNAGRTGETDGGSQKKKKKKGLTLRLAAGATSR